MHHVKLFTFLYEVIKDQDTGTIILLVLMGYTITEIFMLNV